MATKGSSIDYLVVKNCRLCNGKLTRILRFDDFALTGVFPREGEDVTRGPMTLMQCDSCGLLQLEEAYARVELYGDNYGYRSGLNSSMVQHLANVARYLEAAQQLQPFIRDTSIYLHERLQAGARVVSEGAQGTLLDIDHGSYPFVTSSSPTVGGSLTGLGIGVTHIERVLGVAKAFSTRVGGGPMPTEQNNAIGDRLRGSGENFWDEFGTTTGRPRRCGWLDAVMLRYAAAINGFTELALTKLDVLSGFEELKIAVAYELDGVRMAYPPSTAEAQARAVPIYETLAGWTENISNARQASELPENALKYIGRVAELCGVPIRMVSVGPERSQLVTL